jgi:hypothetical protein
MKLEERFLDDVLRLGRILKNGIGDRIKPPAAYYPKRTTPPIRAEFLSTAST